MPRRQKRLASGRRIDYLELGDPAGAPAIYLHGTPSSASEARWLHAAARAHGVRLVSPDRPGYLGSDAASDPSFLAVAHDVVELAGALSLGRFAVVGFSGGAGYALATAHAAPDQVTVVHLGGGMGSLAGDGWHGGAWLPRWLVFDLAAHAPRVAGPPLAGLLRLLARGIRTRLDTPAEAAIWFFTGSDRGAQVAAIAEYVRTSPPEDLRGELADYAAGTAATRAIVDDLAAYARPWPFALGDIATPVEIWHGRDDPAVPVRFAERAARELGRAQAHLFDGEGHFVFHTHADAVAASIRRHAAR
jgi:pimeloyl-ACP methyl ester carboxylesterase